MRIQIMKTYKESLNNILTHKHEWLKVAYGPLLVWALGFLIIALAYVATGQPLNINTLSQGTETPANVPLFLVFASIVYHIVYFIAITSLYINGYRYAVLGGRGDRLLTLNLNMRFVKMILYTILLSLLGMVYVGVAAGIVVGVHLLFDSTAVSVILGILLGLFGFYLMFRVILFPVVVSLDQSQPFKTSWHLMKGNVLRFLGLMILIGLTMTAVGIVLGIAVMLAGMLFFMGGPIFGTIALILGMFALIFFVLFSWAFNTKAMGLIYLDLSGYKLGAKSPA